MTGVKEFSFEDLCKQPHQRVMKTEISGLGVITLTELASSELASLQQESDQIIDDFKSVSAARDRLTMSDDSASLDQRERDIEVRDLDMVARWSVRLLRGKKGTAKQVEDIKKNLSPAVRQAIYLRGIEFNVLRDEYREKIEKNS